MGLVFAHPYRETDATKEGGCKFTANEMLLCAKYQARSTHARITGEGELATAEAAANQRFVTLKVNPLGPAVTDELQCEAYQMSDEICDLVMPAEFWATTEDGAPAFRPPDGWSTPIKQANTKPAKLKTKVHKDLCCELLK